MKKFVFLTALSLSGLLSSQTIFLSPVKSIQRIPGAAMTTFSAGGNHYVLHKKYRMQAPIMFDLQLDAYSPKLETMGSYRIDESLDMGAPNLYEGIFALGDKMVMFKSEFKKEGDVKKSVVYAYPFDAAGERQAGVELTSFPGEKAMNAGNFQVNVSPDGSKIAVLSEYPQVKETNEKGMITVFDNSFKEIWKKEYEFPYESAKAYSNDVFVNNNGVVFILKKVDRKKELPFYTIITFTDKGAGMTENKPDLGLNGMISTYKAHWSQEGDLILGGFYYLNKKIGINVETPNGPFYIKAFASNGAVTAKTASTELLQNLKTTQLIPQADNGFILIGEQQYENSTPIPNTQFQYNYEHVNVNIMAVKMNGDGSMAWSQVIKREVKSMNDGGRTNSVFALVKDGNVILVYKDFQYKHDGQNHTVVGPGLANVMAYAVTTLGPDGKISSDTYIKDSRLAGKTGDYYLIPSTGRQSGNNECFMISCRGEDLVATKITF